MLDDCKTPFQRERGLQQIPTLGEQPSALADWGVGRTRTNKTTRQTTVCGALGQSVVMELEDHRVLHPPSEFKYIHHYLWHFSSANNCHVLWKYLITSHAVTTLLVKSCKQGMKYKMLHFYNSNWLEYKEWFAQNIICPWNITAEKVLGLIPLSK